jgi:Flp pilus assembly protein TadD
VRGSRRVLSALVVMLLTGCATAGLEGRAALSRGDYGEAVRRFEEALAAEPTHEGDLLGLGVARYKLEDLDGARRAFQEALARAPDAVTAHLYLALIAIRGGDDATADAHLSGYLAIGAPPRLAAQLDRARRALAGPVTPAMRAYMTGTLEDAYQSAGEVASALRAAHDAELRRISNEFYRLPYDSCRCR